MASSVKNEVVCVLAMQLDLNTFVAENVRKSQSLNRKKE